MLNVYDYKNLILGAKETPTLPLRDKALMFREWTHEDKSVEQGNSSRNLDCVA